MNISECFGNFRSLFDHSQPTIDTIKKSQDKEFISSLITIRLKLCRKMSSVITLFRISGHGSYFIIFIYGLCSLVIILK